MTRLLLRALGGGLLGAVLALASVALHQSWAFLALAAVTVLAVLVALPDGWSRLPLAAGFAVVVGRSAVPRPEGDYLVAADPHGWVLLGLTLGLGLGAVVSLGGREHPGRPGDPGAAAAPAERPAGGHGDRSLP